MRRLLTFSTLCPNSVSPSHGIFALADKLNVARRVHFLGAIPQARLRTLYKAADCLVVVSSREGWANVLLEAMACGTPVVASNVWGTPVVAATAEAGVLMRERSADGIVEAICRLRRGLPDRKATRVYALQLSWDTTTTGHLALFRRVLVERHGELLCVT